MELIEISTQDTDRLAPLVAAFRVQLNAYRGIRSQPNTEEAREELLDFLAAGFPVYAVADGSALLGYIVCRINDNCLWVEQLFVWEAQRRKGLASLLFGKAEELAAALGEDTVYNFVHPNNEGVISFLRSKGYTVLNLIEVRKPYKGEKPGTTIQVGNETFDY